MKIIRCYVFLIIAWLASMILLSQPLGAQEYRFSLDERDLKVTVNQDGSADLDYRFVFTCDQGAHAIDIVDVGMPQKNYSLSQVSAKTPDGTELTDIRPSEYVKPGVEVHLDTMTIEPGKQGTVLVHARIARMVYYDSKDKAYASIEFAPTWFGSQYVHGQTASKVELVFPEGVQSEEPRYHSQPFTSAAIENGRVVYRWIGEVKPDQKYIYGASFPRKYVTSVVSRPLLERPLVKLFLFVVLPGGFIVFMIWLYVAGYRKLLGGIWRWCRGLIWVGGMLLAVAWSLTTNPDLIILIIVVGLSVIPFFFGSNRKMQYLPPTIKVEGLGVKNGLTAPEAAVLMGKPLDRVLGLVLFGLIRKAAIKVVSDQPLKLEKLPLPADAPPLQTYENDFLKAVKANLTVDQSDVQSMLVDMVKGLNKKMKGFSYKDTVKYYQHIVDEAWKMVDSADTPEVKIQTVEEKADWMLFDDDYSRRFHHSFASGNYFVPRWYVPYAGASAATAPAPGGGGGFKVPKLPGAEFATSFVNWTQGLSSKVVSNIGSVTAAVTGVTNPPPVTHSSSGSSRGGGGGCACACACAGCACACAGGGR